jgi:hypothetical protein
MDIKIGQYRDTLFMAEPKIDETWSLCGVPFNVVAGPMLSRGAALLDMYVLLVRYPLDESDPSRIEDAHAVTKGFCSKYRFRVVDHLNSFPEVQAVISRRNPV